MKNLENMSEQELRNVAEDYGIDHEGMTRQELVQTLRRQMGKAEGEPAET